MEYYYYYIFSISILDMCLSPHVVHKLYRKTSVGETHHDIKMEFNHENHEIQKVMNKQPRMTKRASSSHQSGPPDLHNGPPGPS
jgi:hypothetical protein